MSQIRKSTTFQQQVYPKEQSFAYVNPHRLRDHSKEYFYPLNDEKENVLQDKLKVSKINNNSSSFIPQYREVSAGERKLRDFYDDTIVNHFNQSKIKSTRKNQHQDEMSARQKKYLDLQSSLFLDEEEVREKSPSTCALKDVKLQRQKSIEQVKMKNYLQYKKNQKSNERGVEVVHLEMKGVDRSFDEETFKRLWKDQGYHMVFCRCDYNKLTNQETGKGSFMLRRSGEKGSRAGPDLKVQLAKQGLMIQEKRPNNRLKDLVPDWYVKEDQRMKELKRAYWKKDGGGMVRNRSEISSRAMQNRFMEFSKNL